MKENKSQIKNLEHERALEAWKYINEINKKDDKNFKKEYRSIIMKLPTLIITNGLGQSFAFLKAKGKGDDNKPEEIVYRNIEKWLNQKCNIYWNSNGELIEKVISIQSSTFRQVTSETLSFLSWMKRFADAVLPKEED